MANKQSDDRWPSPIVPDAGELSYLARVEHYRETIPDALVSAFDELISANCTARIAAAACRYTDGYCGMAARLTQPRVAVIYGVSVSVVQSRYREVLETAVAGLSDAGEFAGNERMADRETILG